MRGGTKAGHRKRSPLQQRWQCLWKWGWPALYVWLLLKLFLLKLLLYRATSFLIFNPSILFPTKQWVVAVWCGAPGWGLKNDMAPPWVSKGCKPSTATEHTQIEGAPCALTASILTLCSGLPGYTHSVHTWARPWAWAWVLALGRSAALGAELRPPLPLLFSPLPCCRVLGVSQCDCSRATGAAEHSWWVPLTLLTTSSFRHTFCYSVIPYLGRNRCPLTFWCVL